MTVTQAQVRPDDAAFQRQLERDAVWSRMISPGARIPDLPLIEADLGPIFLRKLLDTGPLVLVFVRHAGSAECETALAAYDEELAGTDAHVVAVSPQRPDLLAEMKHRLGLRLLVGADPRHALIDRFGLGFSAAEAKGVLGTGRATLPHPAVVVADRAGLVRFAEVSAGPAPATPASAILTAIAGTEIRPRR
ncbi:redoxin domain-containing protein [Actinoplanes sp. RD1]|uniref:redoxin domain-containing protein n=1 Tax=Actinoplanes sp. RD1 TaxID=3064538 RepID=UPI00274258E1|nr:redoxin domain-containing protein [Actinoplanes sp. RD1]